MNPAWRLALTFFLAASLGGCSIGGPAITVDDARIAQQTDDAVQFQIHLKAQNKTETPMRLLEYTYSVSVDGQQVYEGRRAAIATLAANSTTQLMLPAVAPRSAMKNLSAVSLANGRYSVSGTLTFVEPGTVAKVLYDARILRPVQGFDGSGEILASID
ncbi:MAG TPA: LEA type 2 family protein [Phycisphaerales bacterium]|nr:LEA type 2 family protein [Phycisphaerales bacterium]